MPESKAPPTKTTATNNYNKRINPMQLTRLACAVAFGLACHSALAATAYVSNEKDDSISVIDLDSPRRGRFDDDDRAGLERVAGLYLGGSRN